MRALLGTLCEADFDATRKGALGAGGFAHQRRAFLAILRDGATQSAPTWVRLPSPICGYVCHFRRGHSLRRNLFARGCSFAACWFKIGCVWAPGRFPKAARRRPSAVGSGCRRHRAGTPSCGQRGVAALCVCPTTSELLPWRYSCFREPLFFEGFSCFPHVPPDHRPFPTVPSPSPSLVWSK
jgi:hypothetical protein